MVKTKREIIGTVINDYLLVFLTEDGDYDLEEDPTDVFPLHTAHNVNKLCHGFWQTGRMKVK